MKKLSIVIPAYNEAKRIGNVLDDVAIFLDKQNFESEVIVVDDGSKDATVDVVKNYKDTFPLNIIQLEKNSGKGKAVAEGIFAADSEYVLFMDADNATRIEELTNFWPLAGACDIVIGSRYLEKSDIVVKQPTYRYLLGRLANLIIQVTAVWGIKDTQCGFKFFKTSVAKDIFKRQRIYRWGFDFEILAIALDLGYTIKEAPVKWYHVSSSRVRPIRAAAKTLLELAQIKWNLIRGKYKKHV